jgi:ABC-2 type transport system permease protein
MIRAFAYVTLLSFKNRILSGLRRLKQPRYLISAVAGFAYLWFVSLRHMVSGSAKFAHILGSDLGIDIVSGIFLGMLLFAWALPGQSGGLEFTEAEIQFLFSAPLTRRQLLLYKIFRMQPQILISSTITSFLMFRQSRFIGVWLSFMAISVYFTTVALGRARLKLAHIGFLTRLVVTLALASAFAWLFYTTAMRTSAEGRAALRQGLQRGGLRSVATGLDQPFQDPVIHGILSLPRLFANAVLPKSLPMLAMSSAALLALAFLFFEIGARLNVSFEEASITASQKKAAMVERMQGRRRGSWVAFKRMPAPFRLPRRSSPELAILWKNLVATMRISIVWVIFLALIFGVIMLEALSTHNRGLLAGVGLMALCASGVFPLLGSALFTQDLRLDLPRMEILKTYPISGERLVAAEIAAPLAMVTLLELFLLAGTSIVLGFSVPDKLKFFASPQFVVVAMLYTIPVCAAQLLIRNAAAVFFPAWVIRSKEEMKGFMVFGQRIVMLIGNLFILALALLPAAILFLPAFLIANRYFHGSSFALAAGIVPSVMLLAGEVWLGIRLLGAQFDRLDVSTEFDTVMV